MIVYFIYKHGESFQPFLYAYTNKKWICDSFLEERNKAMFLFKEKEMSKELYRDFVDKHRGLELGRRGFETSPPSPTIFNKRAHVYLMATANEEIDVITKVDTVLGELSRHTFGYAQCFDDELIEALHLLHYYEIYKFWALPFSDDCGFLDGISNNLVNGEDGKYLVDSFGVFMYLYGYTLDKKGILKSNED